MWKLTPTVSFDTETTGLDVPHIDLPFAVSMCNTELETWYCEWDVDPKTRKPKPTKKDLDFLRKVLGHKSRVKVAHNIMFDVQGLHGVGVDVSTPYADTMIQVKRARTNLFRYALKPLAKQFLEIDDDDEQELKDVVVICRRLAKRWGWTLGEVVAQDYWLPRAVKRLHPAVYRDKLPSNAAELCERYCRLDSERAMLLHLLMNQVADDAAKEGFEREMQLLPVVIDMQRQGWRVHPDKITETRKILEADIREYKRTLSAWSDEGMDKFTPAALAKLVYDDLELTSFDGKRSVDKDHLEKLDHEVAHTILDLRDADGCVTKFLNPFEKFMVKQGKEYVMYPNFKQAGARTFRFSATRPPIQTIPDAEKSKSNMSARQCIGPRIGTVWYLIDYSSLQVRIFADLANDKTMLAALRDGLDPHAQAARLAWNGENNKAGVRIISNTVSLPAHREALQDWCHNNNVSRLYESQSWEDLGVALLEESEWDIIDAESIFGAKKARATAKTIFFLKLYGGGAGKASKGLKCDLQEAKRTLADYDRVMPRIRSWSREVQNFALKHGYIETPYGTRIHTDQGFEYRAVNYIVQGTEADFVKDRMLAVAKIIKTTPFNLLGQVHDELAFNAPDKNMRTHKTVLRKIKACLEDHTGHFKIEMPCEIDLVKRYWNDRKEIQV